MICVTNRDIEKMVSEALFRQDLMYRINLMVIHLPPLHKRINELPEIVRHLLLRLGAPENGISNEATAILKSLERTLQQVEEEHISAVLKQMGGDVNNAANL